MLSKRPLQVHAQGAKDCGFTRVLVSTHNDLALRVVAVRSLRGGRPSRKGPSSEPTIGPGS